MRTIPTGALAQAVILATLMAGCAANDTATTYTNTGYDEANYDLRLCWKQFVYRRATDGQPITNQRYLVRSIRNEIVGSGMTNEKGETIPVRCDPRGPLTSDPVYD